MVLAVYRHWTNSKKLKYLLYYLISQVGTKFQEILIGVDLSVCSYLAEEVWLLLRRSFMLMALLSTND